MAKKANQSRGKRVTRRAGAAEPTRGATEFAQALSIGHRPDPILTPQQEDLLRQFQTNLLSLVSHELRTPLTSVLNALTLIESQGPSAEFLAMAQNAAKSLDRSLSALLDLAAIETGVFHVRLREVDLERLLRSRMRIRGEVPLEIAVAGENLALADPAKLARAVDLCLDLLRSRAEAGQVARVAQGRIEFRFRLRPEVVDSWENLWTEAEAGSRGRVEIPLRVFAEAARDEGSFLTRHGDSGLGAELLVAHEILRQHGGRFTRSHEAGLETLALVLPELRTEEALQRILDSRAERLAAEPGTLTLALVRAGGDSQALARRLRENLIRATDAAYALESEGLVALVLEDCRASGAKSAIERVLRAARGAGHAFGHASLPDEAEGSRLLIALARQRLAG